MDPDTCLDGILDIISEHDNGEKLDDETINRLVELFGGLHDWLSTGGFLPRDWSRS